MDKIKEALDGIDVNYYYTVAETQSRPNILRAELKDLLEEIRAVKALQSQEEKKEETKCTQHSTRSPMGKYMFQCDVCGEWYDPGKEKKSEN